MTSKEDALAISRMRERLGDYEHVQKSDFDALVADALLLQDDSIVLDIGTADGRQPQQFQGRGHGGMIMGVEPNNSAPDYVDQPVIEQDEFVTAFRRRNARGVQDIRDIARYGWSHMYYPGEKILEDAFAGDIHRPKMPPVKMIKGFYAHDLSVLADDSVDRILAQAVLYYEKDRPAAYREIKRLLKEGGWAVITTSGHDNRPIKAAIEYIVHKRYGGIDPPTRDNETFDTETAKEELPSNFTHAYCLEFEGEIDRSDSLARESGLKAAGSRWDKHTPRPDEERYMEILNTHGRAFSNLIFLGLKIRERAKRSIFIVSDYDIEDKVAEINAHLPEDVGARFVRVYPKQPQNDISSNGE